MNANEMRKHFQEVMAGDIGAHLREAHGITEVPKSKAAQARLHSEQDHSAVPAIEDAEAARNAAVIKGVTRPATETTNRPAAKATPKTTARKAPASRKPTAKAPAKSAKTPAAPAKSAPAKATTRTRTAPAKSTTKTTTAPAPAASANGTSTRETNQDLARKLATLVATEFAKASPDAKAKLAYWLHSLPTGGEGGSWNRWWPESLPRPETADWRKPS